MPRCHLPGCLLQVKPSSPASLPRSIAASLPSRSVRTNLQTNRPTRTILKDYFIPRIPALNPPVPVSNDKFVRTGEDSTREYRGPHSFGPSQSRRPSSNGQPGEMSTKPRPGGPTGGLVDKGSKEPSLAVVPEEAQRSSSLRSRTPLLNRHARPCALAAKPCLPVASNARTTRAHKGNHNPSGGLRPKGRRSSIASRHRSRGPATTSIVSPRLPSRLSCLPLSRFPAFRSLSPLSMRHPPQDPTPFRAKDANPLRLIRGHITHRRSNSP